MTRLATAVVPISVADVADSGLWVSFAICRSLFAKCPDNLSQATLLALLRHALQQPLPISVADVADSGLWVSFGICRSLFAGCPDDLSQPTLLALLRHALQQMLYPLAWLTWLTQICGSLLRFAGFFLPSVLTI